MSKQAIKENLNYIQEKYLSKLNYWESNTIGYMIVDKSYNILKTNEYFRKLYLLDEEDNATLDSISLYQKINTHTLQLANRTIFDYDKTLALQNKNIDKLHKIVIEKGTPVQFIYFVLYEGEFKSLLLHFIPLYNEDGHIIGMHQVVSDYDFWGIVDALSVVGNSPDREYLTLSNKINPPNIHLSPRQHEIIFLLLHKVGLRQAAQILQISYGNISKIVHEYLCPKFEIHKGGAVALIKKAKELGYSQLIPQSFCNPSLIILSAVIREQIKDDDSLIVSSND